MERFGHENKLFTIAGKLVDCFYVSVLWLLFSLPVVTFGASCAALYYTVHKTIRGGRGYIWQSFWGAFRSNFKQTVRLWLLMLLTFAFLFADLRITYIAVTKGMPFRGLCFVFLFLLLFWVVWSIVLFAYAARFENGVKDTLKNAAVISLAHLPWAVLILAAVLIAALFVFLVPPMVLLLPAGVAYLCEMILERIFCKYMSKEDLERESLLMERSL